MFGGDAFTHEVRAAILTLTKQLSCHYVGPLFSPAIQAMISMAALL